MGAQAAAAMEAIGCAAPETDHHVRVGYLVRIREAGFAQPDLPVETPLHITATLEGGAPPLAVYRISVAVGGVEVVWAVLSTLSNANSGVAR
jgi:predicted hotdog family 3-hydroxylacyl-ACP dehydratase